MFLNNQGLQDTLLSRFLANEGGRSFRNLQPRTRMLIGLGIIVYSGVGILVSNGAERRFDMVPSEEDKERLKRAIPKITTVDRHQ